MKNVIVIAICFLLLSCMNKEQIKKDSESLTTETTVEIDILPVEKISIRDPFFEKLEYWKFKNNYVNVSLYPYIEFTLISNLPGFSTAVITGDRINIHEGEGSFRALAIDYMDFGTFYGVEFSDNIITLTSYYFPGYMQTKVFEIQYVLDDENITSFNYIHYDSRGEYEVTEIIHLDNKVVLKDKNGKETVLYKIEPEELENLYVSRLREEFIRSIELLHKGYDYKVEDYPGASVFYNLAKTEMSIFEECVYEYYTNEDGIVESINERLLEFINKIKSKWM